MQKIQISCLGLLFATGMISAAVPCNNFEILVRNKLPYPLMSTKVKLNGAEMNPKLLEIDSKAEKGFIITGSNSKIPMTGELIFKTVSIPVTTVHIEFNLTNQVFLCEHSSKKTDNPFAVSHARGHNHVTYSIG